VAHGQTSRDSHAAWYVALAALTVLLASLVAIAATWYVFFDCGADDRCTRESTVPFVIAVASVAAAVGMTLASLSRSGWHVLDRIPMGHPLLWLAASLVLALLSMSMIWSSP